jgi:type I restriction enzyme S subunit
MKAQEIIAAYSAVTQEVDKVGWRQATLGEFVASRTKGIVPNKTPDATFELYSVPSLDTGVPEIILGGEIGSNKQIVDEGTVLLCKINPRINRTWVVSSHTTHQKIASTEWITFPPNDAFEPKYLAYYLKQNVIRDFLSANASGVGGSLMRVKPATITDFPFPLAPLDQQKCIVAEIEKQFSRLDEAIANLKRVKANLKRYKAAVLKAAVEGRLVETEAELARREGRSYETGAQLLQRILETRRSQWQGKAKYKEPAAPDTIDLPELPEGWVWASLDQLSWGSGYGTSTKCAYENEGPPVLRIPNVDKDAIDLSEVKYAPVDFHVGEDEALSPGDMLIIRTNGSKSLIGRAAIVTTPFQQLTSYASYLIRFRLTGDETLSAWVLSYWQSHSSRLWIESKAATSAGQHNISMSVLATAPVPVPPAEEQHRIVAEVDRRLSLLREAEVQVDANLQRAERLRQSILSKAFSA